MNVGYAVVGLLIGGVIAGSGAFFVVSAASGALIGLLLARMTRLEQRIRQLESSPRKPSPAPITPPPRPETESPAPVPPERTTAGQQPQFPVDEDASASPARSPGDPPAQKKMPKRPS